MMTVRLYVSFAADFIAVVLMIYQLIRLNKVSIKKDEIKHYFRRFSGLVLLICVLHLLKTCADIHLGGITPRDFAELSEMPTAWYWTEVTALFIDIFLSTVFLYKWIHFMSWYLYDDRDYIRRKFWLGFAPLIISAAVCIVSIPMAVMSEWGLWFFAVSICIAFLVRIFYFLICLGLLRNFKKQNGYLRFFNPWVFFIPVAATWLIQDLINLGVASLGTAVGVLLIFFSIIGEERYMDLDTGFYNMDFAGFLKRLIEKNKYEPCSAMTFTLDSPEEMKDFSKILKTQLPADCEPILRNDHEVVVLTNVRERGPLTMVIEDVKEASKEVKTGCTLKKKKETTEEFMERVL